MYLQSIHLTRLLSRLISVKSLHSEWRITELFSAECGASLNSSRVATAELNVYPYIIPAQNILGDIFPRQKEDTSFTLLPAVPRSGKCRDQHQRPHTARGKKVFGVKKLSWRRVVARSEQSEHT